MPPKRKRRSSNDRTASRKPIDKIVNESGDKMTHTDLINDLETVKIDSKQENKPGTTSKVLTDWDRIEEAYFENPSNPPFSKYGYVVSVKKQSGKTILVWNNQKRIVED